VGRIIERVMVTGLDPARLDRLFKIGIDEVSWRKGHSSIALVSDHATGKFVWGAPGKDTATLDGFFDTLGPDGSGRIEAISMDMGPAFAKSAAYGTYELRDEVVGPLSDLVDEKERCSGGPSDPAPPGQVREPWLGRRALSGPAAEMS
jgi:hypothetical protein